MVSAKGLNQSQELMTHTMDDVRDWEPSQPNTNPYDTTELEMAYGQSFSSMQLGKAMYAAGMDMLQDTISDFKGRVGLLEAEAAQAQQDIHSEDYLTRQEATFNLEQNLKQLSRQGADFSQGSRAAQQMATLSDMGKNVTQISTAAGIAGSNEELNRKAQSYDALQSSNDAILGALGGAASGQMAQMGLSGDLARMGLHGMGQASSAMSKNRLALAQSALTHGGMRADALKARMGAAGKRASAEQDAYETRVKGRLDADAIRRGTKRDTVGGIARGVAGVGGAITTIMKPKKKGKK